MKKRKHLGCFNITEEAAGIFNRIGQQAGEAPEQTEAIIHCIDDLLSINRKLSKRNHSGNKHQTMLNRITKLEI